MFFSSIEDELYFSYAEEELRVLSMRSAIEEASEDLFGFYDLALSSVEKSWFSEISIQGDLNYVTYLHDKKISHELDLSSIFQDKVELQNVNTLSSIENLIYRLLSNAISASDINDAEIIVRLEKSYSSDLNADGLPCVYWHIDKSYKEIAGRRSLSDSELKQNIFIMVLKGERTLYYREDSALRELFFDLGRDSEFFYGISLVDCVEGEDFRAIFDNSKIVELQLGSGSVHVTSSLHGAIHASPTRSIEGRLLLLITPMSLNE